MSEVSHLAATLFRRAAGRGRLMVAIAGPPGAGKSTLATELAMLLPEGTAAVVPMDGFHYDNVILEARGLMARKGAPETFDCDGLASLLARLRAGDRDVAVPLFDRSANLSRGAAAIVAREVRFVLVEGNYLLCDIDPWRALAPLFDVTVSVSVPFDELERRLVRRWIDHGLDAEAALRRARENDIANAHTVIARGRAAEIVIHAADD